jgi:hypothetical protein
LVDSFPATDRFTVSPLFGDAYFAHKYAHGRARIGDVLRAFARRL